VPAFPQSKEVTTAHAWATLEEAASAADAQAFAGSVAMVDWDACGADELRRAIHLALEAGAPLVARALATDGVTRFPEHSELQKLAYLLAPPRIIRHETADPSVQLNRHWLRAHADHYRGQWVALREGELLAAGTSALDLKKRIGELDGVLLTRVY
jgi:hypothetical protein